MKKAVIPLLVVSLAGNIALVVSALSSGRSGDASASGATGSAAVGMLDARPVATDGPEGQSAPGAGPLSTWVQIESVDYRVFRDRLRAAGFPEPYVRMIVWQRIRRAHRPDMLALVEKRGERPFWVARDDAADRKIREEEQALDSAMRAEFKEYFTPGMGEESRARQARERFAFLPADKAEQVARISSDYDELMRKVRSEMTGFIQLDEDQQKLALLEQERRADLAAVLSPDELELYDLNTSNTANSMRSRLALFDPTEAEFRTIFAVQRRFDLEYGTGFFGIPTQSAMRARADAQKQLNQQIAQVLGADRYADYERATNFAYVNAVKITDHFNLPRENAVAVYGLEAEYRTRAQELMRSAPDREAAAAAAQALAAEASSRVNALLGEEGARAFRDAGGYWLRNLEEQSRRASGTRQP